MKFNKEQFKNKINLEVWDSLVQKTKDDIENALKEYQPRTHCMKCYCYNEDGEIAHEFEKQKELFQLLGTSQTTISTYLNKQWNLKGYLLSKLKLDKEQAKTIYKFNRENGFTYQSNTTKRKQPIYCYNQNGKLEGAYDCQHSYFQRFRQGTNVLEKDKIYENRLISKKRYDSITARRIYNLLLKT